ncbi:trehalose-phosphatase [Cupriavidus necator]|uniref:Trehalose 6-phosphate phosphatase n=1 Tax=Cupriavidus necator (strain ATCC 17699 / DSM 428 / KCTC 22496 / NCIMB 10442 / H16 / Stanier 337) TaxID=381666 RepID=Q0KEJ3_CUPNH|nr:MULTISPECIES: trehalose-phosphatase [Cupriavidus]EON16437.1 trehalose-phosphatase [Cupriavidus sp. GA3-3]QCB99523.1 trehalose-phosphatase [Cupriavidus necator H16]QQB77660.1 trehalose-phosphatase [Cupriavidus necator]WKA41355.1 trehalose-phosphatase [Cupriavidus necator]CAJ91578.1 Trehalose-6-phosphatase [Cupriavidus necator H16]
MPQLPLIESNTALFLDFDGTLADLAPRPELVQVEPELVGTLHTLFQRLDGALAVISGRPISELDHFLQPLRLPAAGVHGAEFRTDGGMVSKTSAAPGLELLIPHLEALVRAYPALRLERKSVAVAIHYRQAPELAGVVDAAVTEVLRHAVGLEALPGKMVVEIKPAGVDKGDAIAAFMKSAPFAERMPLFAGDDLTDEPGFAAVRKLGGLGVLVGQRETVASVTVPGPAALRSWLHRSARALEGAGGHPRAVPNEAEPGPARRTTTS